MLPSNRLAARGSEGASLNSGIGTNNQAAHARAKFSSPDTSPSCQPYLSSYSEKKSNIYETSEKQKNNNSKTHFS